MDTSGLRKGGEESKNIFTSIGKTAENIGQNIDGVFDNIGKKIAAIFTVDMAGKFIKNVVNVRGEFQQLEVAFSTLLRSEEKANQLMSDAVDLAAKTPFDLQGVANGARQLIAYGFESEKVMDTMRRLGDVAAGLGLPLERLTYLYGTTRVQGRLYARDMLQFTNSGIPLLDELAKMYGKTTAQINEMVSAGKIGFSDVEKVIRKMTDEGGQFANLMERESKTITGQISNIGDAIDTMFNEIGKKSEGFINTALSGVSYLVENYEKVGQAIGDAVVMFGAYKAALMTVSAAHTVAAATAKGYTVAELAQYRALLLVEKAQKLLNKTMLANPYVLAATAIAGIVTWSIRYNKSINDGTRAISELEKATKRLNKENREKEAAAQEHIKTLRDEKSTQNQREEAIRSLINTYPELISKYKDQKAELIDIRQLELDISNIQLTRQMNNDVALLNEYNRELASLNAEMAKAKEAMNDSSTADTAVQSFQSLQTEITNTEKKISALEDRLYGDTYSSLMNGPEKPSGAAGGQSGSIRSLNDIVKDIKNYQTQINELRKKANTGLTEQEAASLQELEKSLKSAKDEYQSFAGVAYDKKTDTKAEDKRKQAIKKFGEDAAELIVSVEDDITSKQLEAMADGAEKVSKQQELELKQLMDRAKKIGEQMNALYQGNTDLAARPHVDASILNAMGWNAGSGTATVFSSDYDIRDKSGKSRRILVTPILPDGQVLSQNELERYIDEVLEGSSDILAADKAGKSIVIGVDVDENAGEQLHEMQELYDALLDAVNRYGEAVRSTDITNKIASYQTDESKRKKMAAQLEEDLALLKKLRSEAKEGSNTADLDSAIAGIENQQMQNSGLADFKTYQEKVLDIQKKYQELRNAAVAEGNEERLRLVNKGEQEALSSLDSEMLMESDTWTKLFTDLGSLTYKEARDMIEKVQAQLGNLKLSPIDYQTVVENLNKAKQEIATDNPFRSLVAYWKDYKKAQDDASKPQAVQGMMDSINSIVGNVSKAGDALSEMFSSFGNDELADGIGTAVDLLGDMGTAATGVGKIMSGDILGGVTDIITGLADAITVFNRLHDNAYQKAIEEDAKLIDNLKNIYDELSEKISSAFGSNASGLIEKQNAALRQQNSLIQDQIRNEQSKKRSDEDAIKEYQDAIKENNRLIEDNKRAALDAILGEDIMSAISSFSEAIADAWANGETAAKNAKDTVKKMLQQTVIEAVKAYVQASGAMERIRLTIKDAMADEIITEDERNRIETQAQQLADEVQKKYGWADKLFGDQEATTREAATKNSLGASQESVDESNGRLTAIQGIADDIRTEQRIQTSLIQDVRSQSAMIAEEVMGIHSDTSEIRAAAFEMQSYLKEIKSNVGTITDKGVNML